MTGIIMLPKRYEHGTVGTVSGQLRKRKFFYTYILYQLSQLSRLSHSCLSHTRARARARAGARAHVRLYVAKIMGQSGQLRKLFRPKGLRQNNCPEEVQLSRDTTRDS